MSATETTGALVAPQQVTLEDAVGDTHGAGPVARKFFDSLYAMLEPLVIPTDGDGFILEGAYQHGFETIDDDATLFVVSGAKLIEFVKLQRQVAADKATREANETFEAVSRGRLRLIRELDVALNGEVGAAKQASMSDLIAQVTRQQCVQSLRLRDGMRLNFRAPDGRRATMYLDVVLANAEHDDTIRRHVVATMRDAIAAYPIAGEPLK